ncbi:MAG: gamma-glutamylcyclotransferase family protein [Methylosarcina sp.]
MNNDYLFVYGTLRRSANSEMSQLLARNAVFIDYAVFQGRLYKIDYYPGAVPSNDPGHRVPGEVYLLADAKSLLPCLDRYEGCGLEFPEPNEYRRQQREVLLNNGHIMSAWIYLYNRATTGLELIE